MGHVGEELGADCLDLWEAGYYELKPLAATFRDAAGKLDLADTGLGNLYRDSLLGGPYGPVRDAWSDFRDDVFTILRETAENLNLTGDALMTAANEYMASDTTAQNTFKALQPAVVAAHPQNPVPPK
ncbi:MAG: hypothetical protein QOE51_1450 [Actinoplanes sp.]|jgi:hypothetical protein|nr:hypothetical protein [Actinoplanes sp.]